MSVTTIIGAQWGDEGKGKITDYLADDSKVVARSQGGNNAGHTIVIDGKKYGIMNLTAEVVANIGIRADINKYNAADSKLWTN